MTEDKEQIKDLEEMREQMALLRSKLESQDIVNERLLRAAIRSRVKSLNRDACILGVVSVLSIPYCLWCFRLIGLSWAFAIVTVLFLLTAFGFNIYAHRGFRATELATKPMTEVARRTIRLRMLYARWLRFGLPFIVCWLAWVAYEILALTSIPYEERVGILVGGTIGGVIGGALGLLSYRRTRRLTREIIEQIGETDGNV